MKLMLRTVLLRVAFRLQRSSIMGSKCSARLKLEKESIE